MTFSTLSCQLGLCKKHCQKTYAPKNKACIFNSKKLERQQFPKLKKNRKNQLRNVAFSKRKTLMNINCKKSLEATNKQKK